MADISASQLLVYYNMSSYLNSVDNTQFTMTNNGNLSFTTDSYCLHDGCVSFNGSGQGLNTTDSGNYGDLRSFKNSTLNFWIYPIASDSYIINQPNASVISRSNWYVYVTATWQLELPNNFCNGTFYSGSNLIEPNKWQMITLVVNSTHIYIYKNATYVGQCANGTISTSYDTPIEIGGKDANSGPFYTDFNGSIDEVGFWNGTMNLNEILQLYTDIKQEFTINAENYTNITFETEHKTFTINFSYSNSSYYSSAATLVYNGTSYTGTQIGTDTFRVTRKTPTINNIGIFPFYWQMEASDGIRTVYSNSSLHNQTVNSTIFANCNASLTTSYLNISFKDETTSNPLMANITSSSFSWWLGDGTYNRTYSYTNITGGSYSYPFCFYPDYKNISLELTLYYSASGYPQRSWSYNNIFTNNTYNKTLLLLGSAAGQDVTFQVVDSASYPISGVTANATKVSTGGLVASGTTGDDGGVTFFLDPNYQHTFTFVKAGYTTTSMTINPTQTSYTIHMTSTTATSNESNDYYRDISFQIAPVSSYLENRTDYTFNFTIETGYWTIQSFGFTLWNETLAIGSKSAATNGGTVSITNNTANFTRLTMRYYYVINGTYMNGSATWIILDTSGSEWSIKTFFADLKTYVATGMFGLDDFGLALLTFFSIFIIAGIMSWKYGLTSPAAIMGIIFALTLFFDVGLGIIPYPAWIDSNIPVATIFIGILFAGVLFREVTR